MRAGVSAELPIRRQLRLSATNSPLFVLNDMHFGLEERIRRVTPERQVVACRDMPQKRRSAFWTMTGEGSYRWLQAA